MFLKALGFSAVALVGALVVAFFFAQPERRDEPTVDDVIRLFDRIAFASSENKEVQLPFVRRWTAPVRVGVIGGPAEIAESEAPWLDGVRRMALLYDTLPGLDVALVASADFEIGGAEMEAAATAANLRIIMVPNDAVLDFIGTANLPPAAANELGGGRDGCVVLGTETPVLSDVTILLRQDLSASRRNICLGEGMARAMGYYIDAKWASEVFRERQKALTFHPLGRLAAALVYDAALTPGMPREQALAAARAALEAKGLSAGEATDGGN
ncbi:DUF2927 domain-containing protein [Novispirillum sp. DQ9]|uniref:DUF2927 domain-containing protein n=1 Tax=Novispirillum sp. DQ9 TaxID=3398612 RepID=UPI003C79A1A3